MSPNGHHVQNNVQYSVPSYTTRYNRIISEM